MTLNVVNVDSSGRGTRETCPKELGDSQLCWPFVWWSFSQVFLLWAYEMKQIQKEVSLFSISSTYLKGRNWNGEFPSLGICFIPLCKLSNDDKSRILIKTWIKIWNINKTQTSRLIEHTHKRMGWNALSFLQFLNKI